MNESKVTSTSVECVELTTIFMALVRKLMGDGNQTLTVIFLNYTVKLFYIFINYLYNLIIFVVSCICMYIGKSLVTSC